MSVMEYFIMSIRCLLSVIDACYLSVMLWKNSSNISDTNVSSILVVGKSLYCIDFLGRKINLSGISPAKCS